MPAGSLRIPGEKHLIGGEGRAGGANQLVGLLQDVDVVRLLSRKKAEGYKQGTGRQPYQHDPAAGTFVSGVE